MKGEIPFSSPCVVGHEITGEVVEHGRNTDSGVITRYMWFDKNLCTDFIVGNISL